MPTSDRRELLFKAKLDDEVSRPLKKIGDQADDTTGDLERVNLGLKTLDEKSAEATATIAKLRTEIAKTGDLELIKDVTKQEQRLKQLARQRKSLLGDVIKPDEEAEKVGVSFATKLGPVIVRTLPSALTAGGGVGVAVGAPLVAGLVAYLGGAAAGGALAAGAAAAVAGGVKLAARDVEVQAAAKGLGDSISSQLEDAAAPFVPATLRSINIVKTSFRSLDRDIKGIFGDSAGYLEPLTRGLTGAVREAVPGFRKLVTEARPVVDMLERQLPELGRDVGDAFATLSEHSEEGAVAIGYLIEIAGAGIKTVAGTIGVLAEAFKWLDLAGAALVGNHAQFAEYIKTEGKSAVEGFLEKIKNLGTEAHDTATEFDTLNESVKNLANDAIEAERANINMEEAIKRAAQAGRENNAGISDGSKAALENRKALIDLAAETNTAAEAIYNQTGNWNDAKAASERGRTAFLQAADAMHVGKAEAQALANALIRIPVNREIHIGLNTNEVLNNANRIEKRLKEVARQYGAKVILTTSFGGAAHTGAGYSTGYSQGGIVHGPGTKGVDSKAALLAPGEVVWDTEAVDAAGGPAAVDRMRRQIKGGLRAPASAGMAAGGPSGYGGMPPLVLDARGANGLEQLFVAWFVQAVERAGGNPRVLEIGGRR